MAEFSLSGLSVDNILNSEERPDVIASKVVNQEQEGDDNEDDDDDDDEIDDSAAQGGDAKKKKKKKNKKKKKKAAGDGTSTEIKLAAGLSVGVPSRLHVSRKLNGFTDYYVKYGQTDPPSIPVSDLFPSGVFPQGDIQPHGKTKYPDGNSSWFRTSAEERR